MRLLKLLLGIALAGIALAQEVLEVNTVEDRLVQYGDQVRMRLEPQFQAAGVTYPPARVTLVFVKDERVLHLYAANATSRDSRFICTYPVLAASGVAGPKLREGDRQVPEGVYCLRELNPNSRYHLSLWIDYPNSFDRARAFEDKRDPGGEIMIHGGAGSRGCVAVGDEAAEDLFVLAALAGVENVTVILTPTDFRQHSLATLVEGAPLWLSGIYAEIEAALSRL